MSQRGNNILKMHHEQYDGGDDIFDGTSDSGSDGEVKEVTESKKPTNLDGINRIITASKLKKKVSNKGKNSKDSKDKLKEHKISKKSSWQDVFPQSKAVVSATLSHLEGNIIKVNHCDSNFLETFGFTDCENRLCFNDLMGKASSQDTLKKLEMSLKSGVCATEYINLYRSDKTTPLSCHVSVLPLKGTANTAVPGEFRIVWGVITIRSASVVDNARVGGIGILGMERVTDAIRVDYHDNNVYSSAEVVKASTQRNIIKKDDIHSDEVSV
mmetsp:Transcript_32379/g.30880  ORF Transcript_32379/g.30880 Transcript_32379/m.30880 type:complete len:270 (+) Transcript_32379:107-916(+)